MAKRWTEPKLVKVYKIVHKDPNDNFDDMYVGSTTETLSTRMCRHRGSCKQGGQCVFYQWLRDVGVHNVSIILIEEHMCSSFEEQRMREQEVKERLCPSLNTKNAYASREVRLRAKARFG
jgi:hypothetical protein